MKDIGIFQKHTTMKEQISKDYKKYLESVAKKFRLTVEDLRNLFDLFFIVDAPPEIEMDLKKTLKLNKMDKWFYDFQGRIEDIITN